MATPLLFWAVTLLSWNKHSSAVLPIRSPQSAEPPAPALNGPIVWGWELLGCPVWLPSIKQSTRDRAPYSPWVGRKREEGSVPARQSWLGSLPVRHLEAEPFSLTPEIGLKISPLPQLAPFGLLNWGANNTAPSSKRGPGIAGHTQTPQATRSVSQPRLPSRRTHLSRSQITRR